MNAPQAPSQLEPLLLESRSPEGVVTLTLNRPAQFNSLSEEMLAALQAAFDRLGADAGARVIVIAAAGKAFCAGHDLKQMKSNPRQEYYEKLFADCAKLMLTIQRVPQPVIARIHGIATAAGCQLVATCDMAIAGESAAFALPGGKGGLFCNTPLVAVARQINRKHALELSITGDPVDAQTAASWGLINRVVADDQLDDAVHDLMRRSIRGSAMAKGIGKRAYYAQVDMDQPKAYAYAIEVMAAGIVTPDCQEGISAFFEKRRPTFTQPAR